MGWNVKNVFNAFLFMLFVISIEAAKELKFTPTDYKIRIETTKEHFEKDDTKSLKYSGEVVITFKKEPVTVGGEFKIVLDTNPNTEVKSATLKKQNSDTTELECKHKIEKNKLELTCPKEADGVEVLELTVKYANPFGDDMTGFYRSSYTDSSKKKSWLLTTHFEPVYARNAFPCFDRPDLKAFFTVSIKVPKTISTVLSNTEVEGTPKEEGEFRTYSFKKTNIPMSTYLVAFTAANFGSTVPLEFKSPYGGNTAVTKYLRTYGRPDIIKEDGDFAQHAGKAALEELTKYLGEGYALNKVDQVGIPDFSAGAMENFGHISFREKSLYVNKNSSTTMTKQSNLLTIVHELVHQWFGNLVTLENWNYIWLNEAFANYLEYIIASKFNGEKIDTSKWNLMEQMVVNEIHSRAFETDGLTSSKPLTDNITDESLILPAFNDIPYSKGAAVLRMWHFSLGQEKFQNSLKKYITERKEKSANPTQLYDAFKSEAAMSKEYFETWTVQMGYPVVEVQKNGNESYKLTQSRFTWEKSAGKEKGWEIPITYFTDNQNQESFIFLSPGKVLELKGVKGKWIVVNNNQMGYYRVNYNAENWEALSKALLNETERNKIPELNRAQIINDIFSLARSVQKNYVSYSTAFDLAKYLENEKKFTPWKTALNSFDFVVTKIRKNDKAFDSFKSYLLKLIKPHYKNLTETETDHVEKLKKVEISRWACSLDYEPCVKQAKDLYNSRKYNEYPDIRETVLCAVVRTNNSAWNEIYNKYKEETDSSLKVMYLMALGCTTNSTKAKEYLESTLKDDSGIRMQDLMFVLSSVYNGNIKNLDTAFDFVDKNFAQIAKKYGGINPLGRAIMGISRKLDTKSQCEKLEKLVKKVKESKDVKGATESLDNALKIANANCEWEKEKISQLYKYFNGANSFASSLSLLLLCLFFIFRF